jgi:cellulose synthase/poly-beta-1,6-N-acetylglucosamine synthase-like glycosyltransferase
MYFRKKSGDNDITKHKTNDWPFVTIQLPVYNEMFVVEGLIDSIINLDYPKDKFEVHVLDDSNDETVELVRQKIQKYKDSGYSIEQIKRPERKGFKAGALAYGLSLARGEYIAIFDADFQPKPGFLKEMMPHFAAENIGAVQARWGHLNEDASILTRLQTLHLNGHFQVEQHGRYAGDFLLQFNGTAGIWRKNAILDAGNWKADTITEDLDLSIRVFERCFCTC